MKIEKQAKFMQELQELINRHSMDNESNTPDFLLAEYLMGCLSIYASTLARRDAWFNFKPFGVKLHTHWTTPEGIPDENSPSKT
jgi:hypothetical protein